MGSLGVVWGKIKRVVFPVDLQRLVVVQFMPRNPAVVLCATALEVYEVLMPLSDFLVTNDGFDEEFFDTVNIDGSG